MTGSMNNTNEFTLKNAIIEGMAQRLEEEINECCETTVCTPSHYEKLSKILGITVAAPNKKIIRMKKIILAVSVALALILVGCGAMVFKSEIGEFMESIQGETGMIEYAGSKSGLPETIETVYDFEYVPEGFSLKKMVENPMIISRTWYNDEGNYIGCKQMTFGANTIKVSATGEVDELKFGDICVYYRQTEDGVVYLWEYDGYCFSLTSSLNIMPDEFEPILDGITE